MLKYQMQELVNLIMQPTDVLVSMKSVNGQMVAILNSGKTGLNVKYVYENEGWCLR